MQKSSCRGTAFSQVQLDVGESRIAAATVPLPARRQVKLSPATLDLKSTRGKEKRQELPQFCTKKDCSHH